MTFDSMAVLENPERMAASCHGIWIGRIFHPAFVQFFHTVYIDWYYGVWFQYGRTLSDNRFLRRRHYSEVFSGVELYFDDCKLWIDHYAVHHWKNRRNCRHFLWNAVHYCSGYH